MSLISCKNCGRQISDMAETCPHCGEKTNDEQKTYSKEIYDLFIEGLNTYTEFNYNENTQEGTIIVPQVGIDASLKSVSTIINIRDFFQSEYRELAFAIPLELDLTYRQNASQEDKTKRK